MNTNLVDVVIGSYNHEGFISKAIESVLEQKTNFSYRVIIGDDGSTDGTQSIIRSYAQKYPKIIDTILYKKNKGLIGEGCMRKKLYESCNARYVVILEGDDYWTDPYKLQKQVDFMESNKKCSICYHPVRIEYIGDVPKLWDSIYGINEKSLYNLETFLKEPLKLSGRFPEVPLQGMMIRWEVIPSLPDWFWHVLRGDFALILIFGSLGNIECMSKECMAVHRKHYGGVSTLFFKDPDYMEFDILKIFLYADNYLDYKYHDIFKHHILRSIEYFLMKDQCYKVIAKLNSIFKEYKKSIKFQDYLILLNAFTDEYLSKKNNYSKKELECIKLTFIEDLLLKLIYFYRENKLKEKCIQLFKIITNDNLASLLLNNCNLLKQQLNLIETEITTNFNKNLLEKTKEEEGNLIMKSIKKYFYAEGMDLISFYKYNNYSKIGFYGAGGSFNNHYEFIKKFLSDREIFLFDSDPNKHGVIINGLTIMSPHKIIELKPEVIVITSVFYEEIFKFLLKFKEVHKLKFDIGIFDNKFYLVNL